MSSNAKRQQRSREGVARKLDEIRAELAEQNQQLQELVSLLGIELRRSTPDPRR
jgi:pyrimidine operon attenuation protein/uracil phosphoribosyltransferase